MDNFCCYSKTEIYYSNYYHLTNGNREKHRLWFTILAQHLNHFYNLISEENSCIHCYQVLFVCGTRGTPRVTLEKFRITRQNFSLCKVREEKKNSRTHRPSQDSRLIGPTFFCRYPTLFHPKISIDFDRIRYLSLLPNKKKNNPPITKGLISPHTTHTNKLLKCGGRRTASKKIDEK